MSEQSNQGLGDGESQPNLKTMERLYLAAFCGEFLLRMSRANIADVDLWGRLSWPGIYFACGKLPVDDFFSFTAYGAPWVDHEWLAGFFFNAALLVLGDVGLTLFKWSLALGMIWILWVLNRRFATPPVLVFSISMLAIPIWGVGFGVTARSQNLTFFLFALLLLLLERIRSQNSWLLVGLVVPLALVWVNVHGGFVVGFGVVMLFALGSWLNRAKAKPFLVATGLFGITSLVNPYGAAYWKYIVFAITLDRPEIAEWVSTNPLVPRYWTFVALSLVGVAAMIMAWKNRRKTMDWVPVLVVLAAMAFGWRAVKHQPLFAVAAVAYLPLLIQRGWPDLFVDRRFALELRNGWIERTTRSWLPAGLALVVIVTLGFMLIAEDRPLGVQIPYGNFNPLGSGAMTYPVHAVQFLEKAPFEGNLLAPFDHGEFLMYRLYPKFRVALDGRLEAVYPVATYREMMRFFDSVPPDWRIADEWGADVVLWPQHASLLSRADVPGDWAVVHQDGEYIVFVRWSLLPEQAPDSIDPPRFSEGPVYLNDFFRPEEDRLRFSSYCSEPNHDQEAADFRP